MSRARKQLVCVVSVFCLTLVVGGCGKASSQSKATAKQLATCQRKASAAVDALKAPVKPAVPSASLDAKKAAGKQVWYIAATMSIPFVAQIADGARAAGQAAGAPVKIFDAQGTVSGFNQGINDAVAAHAAAIITQAIDPSVVTNALARAKAAGIPVVDAFSGDPDQALQNGVSAHVTGDWTAGGRQMVDYALKATKCNTDAVIFEESVFAVNVLLVNGVKQEFARLCPWCKYSVQNIQVTSVATDAGPYAEAAIHKDPNLNVLIPVSDGIAQYMVPSVDRLAKGKVIIISHDGTPLNLEFIRKNQSQVADVSFPPLGYIGWLQYDQALRMILQQPAVKVVPPVQIFDKTNLPSSNSQSALFPNFSDYQQQFEKVWGVAR